MIQPRARLYFSHWFKRMKNVINFFELVATFPRSDGRVTAQYCRRAIHDRYIFPTIRRKQRKERERKKQLSQKCRVLCESRMVLASFVLSVMKYIIFSYDSVSKMIANFFQQLCLYVIIIHARFLDLYCMIWHLIVESEKSWSLTIKCNIFLKIFVFITRLYSWFCLLYL